MRTLDLTAKQRLVAAALPRPDVSTGSAEAAVTQVIEAVRERGASAVLEFGEKFDQVRPASLRVPAAVIAAAEAGLDPQVRAALEIAIDRVRQVHAEQVPVNQVTVLGDGAKVTGQYIPVDRVGLYVPGGSAVYPSSVVMNVVPAQIAGVSSIAIASPPQSTNDGWPDPTILAAAGMLGIEEIYAAGGAQAIAWLALGSAEVSQPYDGELGTPVNVITGPGNLWVATAKRLLQGVVGIDSEAGPTEIMIIADESANPAYVAADLISQAEHDEMASSILVTQSQILADQVLAEVELQVAKTKHRERVTAALTGVQSCIVLVRDLAQAVEVANLYGAEHLEIQTADAAAVAAKIRNAGAVFVGSFSPVSLGDYCAGSNHVLPTMGCACHSSGLNVGHFLKLVQFIDYDQRALAAVADVVTTLAQAEDLPAHGEAVAIRFASASDSTVIDGGVPGVKHDATDGGPA